MTIRLTSFGGIRNDAMMRKEAFPMAANYKCEYCWKLVPIKIYKIFATNEYNRTWDIRLCPECLDICNAEWIIFKVSPGIDNEYYSKFSWFWQYMWDEKHIVGYYDN